MNYYIPLPGYELQRKSGPCCSSSKVLARLLDFLKTRPSADVTFVLSQREIKAHRCVIATVSAVFVENFLSGMEVNESRIVHIKDVDENVFSDFIDFCYTGQISKGSDATKLLVLGHEYDAEELKDACDEELVKLLTVENVLKILHVADRCNREELMETCFSFMGRNSISISSSKPWGADEGLLKDSIDIYCRKYEKYYNGTFHNTTVQFHTAQWTLDSSPRKNETRFALLLVPYDSDILILNAFLWIEAKPITSNNFTVALSFSFQNKRHLDEQFLLNLSIILNEKDDQLTKLSRTVSISTSKITPYDITDLIPNSQYIFDKLRDGSGVLTVTLHQATDSAEDTLLINMEDADLISDVTLIVEGEQFHLHKSILASRCAFFSSLFEDNKKEYVLEEIPSNIFATLKRHIYDNEWPEIDQVNLNLLAAACKLQLDKVIDYCQYILRTKLEYDNFVEYFSVASELNLDILKEASFTFMKSNLGKVIYTAPWFKLKNHLNILETLFEDKLTVIHYSMNLIENSG